MPSISSNHSKRYLPFVAVALVLIAVVLWGLLSRQLSTEARVRQHVEAGLGYAKKRDGLAAEKEWRAAVALDPKNAHVWEMLGELYISTQNFTSAVEAFEHLIALAPQTPGAHSRLATALYSLGIESGAFQQSELALKQDPNDVPALAILAFLYGHSGNEARQIECLKTLTTLLPDDKEFLSLYTQLLTVRARYDEALPLIARLEKQQPENHLPYSLRGVIALNQDPSSASTQKAIALFEKAIQKQPQAPFPYLYLGKAYLREHKPQKAKEVLEAMERLVPNKMDLQFELARTYTALGEKDKATKARTHFEKLRAEADRASSLRKLTSSDPNNFEAHKEFGLMNLKAGDYRSAALYLTRASILKPQDQEVKDALAQAEKLDPVLQKINAPDAPTTTGKPL
jgi:cytochrome c-type biogenesis protein CcmH/NrfG